jgi:hypothetical protein
MMIWFGADERTLIESARFSGGSEKEGLSGDVLVTKMSLGGDNVRRPLECRMFFPKAA